MFGPRARMLYRSTPRAAPPGPPGRQAMTATQIKPEVHAIFDEATFTLTYIVFDPATKDAVVIDPGGPGDPSSDERFSDWKSANSLPTDRTPRGDPNRQPSRSDPPSGSPSDPQINLRDRFFEGIAPSIGLGRCYARGKCHGSRRSCQHAFCDCHVVSLSVSIV